MLRAKPELDKLKRGIEEARKHVLEAEEKHREAEEYLAKALAQADDELLRPKLDEMSRLAHLEERSESEDKSLRYLYSILELKGNWNDKSQKILDEVSQILGK